MFIAQANLINIFWMHLYQIDLSLNKQFQNKGPILESKGIHSISQKEGKKYLQRAEKGKIFENFSKKVHNLKIF